MAKDAKALPPLEPTPGATIGPDGLERDEIGAILDSPINRRILASEARRIAISPAFAAAMKGLTDKYMIAFLNLKPSDPTYAEQCVRIQVACNIIPDVCSMLAEIADGVRFDEDRLRQSVKGR